MEELKEFMANCMSVGMPLIIFQENIKNSGILEEVSLDFDELCEEYAYINSERMKGNDYIQLLNDNLSKYVY